MYRNFKSQLGYENGENKIDSYGVDHRNFSLRDEISYQMARTNRENELIKNYNNQGITQDYPQYNTNFWGGNPANNYGFGTSNISDNIENVTNSLKNQNYGFDTNTNNIKSNNVYNTVGNNGTFSTANIQTPPQTLNQLPANRLNNANSMELFNNPPSLQMDLRPKPLNESNSYTTESAWGFPNTKQTPFYEKKAQSIDNNSDKITNKNIDYSLYGNGFSREYIDMMLNDTTYQQALKEYAIPNEGGYIYDKNDPGGETNMGISKRYHPNEDIPNLTRERANAILYNEIWNWNGINKLPKEIKGFIFDYGIRTSPQNAIKVTHQALDISPGGTIIGETTLNKLKNINYENFLQKYKNIVKENDRNNPNYIHYGRGWDKRTNGYHISY